MKTWAPHPFSLRQLQYAAAVGELLSFRLASERCRVAQPSLSAQLAELERGLGVRLFERDRRRVLVTPVGREILGRAEALLRGVDDLVDAARRAADPFAGTLRIGLIPTISPYLLPAVAPALRERYPRLRIVWVEEKTPGLRRSLEAGDLDGAVLARQSDLGELECETIARDPFVIAAPKADPLGSGPPAPASALRGRGVLLLDDGHCFRDQALALCTDARAHEGEFRATSLSTLAQMVAAGAGVTLLPTLAVATETQRANVTVRHFADPAPHRTIVMAWRRGSALGEALRGGTAAVREAYPHAPGAARGAGARRRRRAR